MDLWKPTLRTFLATALAATLGLSPAGAQPQQVPECLLESEVDPLLLGANQVPPDTFADTSVFGSDAWKSNDYHWTHSSMHLQGAPARRKWGACMFFNPDKEFTGKVDMSDWRSALIINNPGPIRVKATITYRNPKGVVLTRFQKDIDPEATYVSGAIELRWFGRGIGSVEVTADGPIVGATLHHFAKMTFADGLMVQDSDFLRPGANSMQQLQMSQGFARTLFSGPFPISSTSRVDFLNGVLPLNCVLNPNSTRATVQISSATASGVPVSTKTVTLDPFGMVLDTSVWDFAEPLYLNNVAGLNLDVISTVTSEDGPILGDFLMVDVFGNSPGTTLDPGKRFRMGSGMMQNSPASRLVNPEHVETGPFAVAVPLTPPPPPLPATPPVSTMMGIANVSGSDIGPVNVRFFNRKGETVTSLTFPSLPAGAARRIHPASSAISQNFAGWASITACGRGLIGWTMREVWDQPDLHGEQFHKVFGEELDGANGGEPGNGFDVTFGGQPWVRKVAPLLRAGGDNANPDWWPSYVNTVNTGGRNTGLYFYRFFDKPGFQLWQTPLPFAGLRFWNTSFTYVDPIVTSLSNVDVSGRFDAQPTGHDSGIVQGMEAIGDPLREWDIPYFLKADGDLPSPPASPEP